MVQDEHRVVIEPINDLSGGLSGAALFLTRINSNSGGPPKYRILKIQDIKPGLLNNKMNEGDLHQLAFSLSSPEFRSEHLVQLAFAPMYHDDKVSILLYEIAGGSVQNYRPVSSYTFPYLCQNIHNKISYELLSQWNVNCNFESEKINPYRMLRGLALNSKRYSTQSLNSSLRK